MPASLANHLFHVRGAALGPDLAGARVASDKAQAHWTAPRAPKEQDNFAWAKSPFGMYSISEQDEKFAVSPTKKTGPMSKLFASRASLEEAQATAQADFERHLSFRREEVSQDAKTVIVSAPNVDGIRSLAVTLVDTEYGFTCEISGSPEAHAAEYDKMERNLEAVQIEVVPQDAIAKAREEEPDWENVRTHHRQGVPRYETGWSWDYPLDGKAPVFGNMYVAFYSLWESINGPGAWRSNPFVAVYDFDLCLKNIDRME